MLVSKLEKWVSLKKPQESAYSSDRPRRPPELLQTLFSRLLDAVMFDSFLQVAFQIQGGHTGSEGMESHAKELPIQLRSSFAHSLAHVSRYRDTILVSLQLLHCSLAERTAMVFR